MTSLTLNRNGTSKYVCRHLVQLCMCMKKRGHTLWARRRLKAILSMVLSIAVYASSETGPAQSGPFGCGDTSTTAATCTPSVTGLVVDGGSRRGKAVAARCRVCRVSSCSHPASWWWIAEAWWRDPTQNRGNRLAVLRRHAEGLLIFLLQDCLLEAQ